MAAATETPSQVTFTFPRVTPVLATLSARSRSAVTIKEHAKTFIGRTDTVLLAKATSPDEFTVRPAFNNGLIGTIFQAYSRHHPLVLRPDDIFLSILVSFGVYVAGNAEALRSVFVSHTGIKELTVNLDDVVDPNVSSLSECGPELWEKFISLMTDTVDANIHCDILEWTTPRFTTTTSVDTTASKVALLAAVREYFGMKLTLGCGLSEVTLMGTVSDWVALRAKVTFLETFPCKELNEWASLLGPVLDKFVSAREGTAVDPKFWQRICTSETRGSGSQQTFRGWFLVFAPFTSEGQYILRTKEQVLRDNIYAEVDDDDIPVSYINVNVKSENRMNGEALNFSLTSGIMMTSVENGSLSPVVGWALSMKKIVTQDDMCEYAMEFSRNHTQDSLSDNNNFQRILSGAMKLAGRLGIPNDKLFDLTEACVYGYSDTSSRGISGREDRDAESDIFEWLKSNKYSHKLFSFLK